MLYDIRSLQGVIDYLKKESYREGIPAIDAEDGMILAAYAHIVRGRGGRVFVDAGAGIGYSTIWILSALRTCDDCTIIAIEYEERRARKLEEVLKGVASDMGVAIEVLSSDAIEVLVDINRIDYAFIDIEKSQYTRALEILEGKMPVGGTALFHNAYFPPPPREFFERISGSRRWDAIIHPTVAGLLAAVRVSG